MNWQAVACAVLALSPGAQPDCACSHGKCDAAGACVCEDSVASGHWAGATCSDCVAGFAGAACGTVCEGGACNPCNGHGACDAGYSGTGRCTCHSDPALGFWDGPACQACLPGYYGPGCDQPCTVCNGHGTCNEGRSGDGACSCHDGWDQGKACTDCVPSRFGDCARECDFTVNGPVAGDRVPCSGHGTCQSGVAGSGKCTMCQPGYAGSGCQLRCACLPEHGTCNDGVAGDGTCVCKSRRLPPDCSACEMGWGGGSCDQACPGSPPCSNNGVCDPSTASCACARGYLNLDCGLSCPGTVPCSLHGECALVAGVPKCTCHAAPATGYFAGDSCSSCMTGYSGSAPDGNGTLCASRCPVNPVTGDVCSNSGTCVDGVCYCARSWDPPAYKDTCGEACEGGVANNGSACFSLCKRGFYGQTCQYTCPGYATNLACSGHGWCTAQGTCVCEPPSSSGQYGGEACDIECPMTAPDLPCGFPANGYCEVATGECVCEGGFFGRSCHDSCPKAAGMVCNGRGTCHDGTRGNGTCACEQGWTGAACEAACSCPGRSTCAENGTCVCESGFQGMCDECVPGLYGGSCNLTCYHGVTSGRECTCEPLFAGENCSIPCPTSAGSGLVCDGHGVCREGSQNDGSCDCYASWYGEACDVHCTPQQCQQMHALVQTQCNTATGVCECKPQWGGPYCNDCSDDFWGTDCNIECDCSHHGTCDRYTGQCSCSSFPGHFAGPACRACDPDYTGVDCTHQKICISPGRPLEPLLIDSITGNSEPVTSYAPYDLFVDTAANGGYVYIGGNPLIAWAASRPQEDLTVNMDASMSGLLSDVFTSDAGSLFVVLSPGRLAATQLLTFASIPRPPTFGTGKPFAASNLQSVSNVSADFVTHFSNSTLAAAFLVEQSSATKRTLRRIDLPCQGPDTTACPEVRTDISEDVTGLAAGPQWIFAVVGNRERNAGLVALRWGPRSFSQEIVRLPRPKVAAGDQGFACKAMSHAVPVGEEGVAAVCETNKNRLSLVFWTSPFDTEAESVVLTSEAGATATAFAFDEPLKAAFVGVSPSAKNAPGTLHKVSLLSKVPRPLDMFSLSYTVVGGEVVPQEVSALYVDEATRALFVLVTPDRSVKVLSFLLWHIEQVEPKTVDAAGGTLITVKGRGFREIKLGAFVAGSSAGVRGGVSCRFEGVANKTAGELVSDTEIICAAPAVAGACEMQAIEVSLDGERFTACGLSIKRSSAPSITATHPQKGNWRGGSIVTVVGENFHATDELSCLFFVGCNATVSDASPLPTCWNASCPAGYTEKLVASGSHSVTYVNSTMIKCLQPASKEIGEAVLEVTLDGCNTGVWGSQYYVLGEPGGLALVEPVDTGILLFTVDGVPGVQLPRIVLAVVDENGVAVGELNSASIANRPVHVDVVGEGLSIQGVLTAFVTDFGVVEFNALTLQPYGGTAASLVFTEMTELWTAALNVSILAPQKLRLLLATAPAPVVESNGGLLTQPVVQLADSHGNAITDSAQLLRFLSSPLQIRCTVAANGSRAAAAETFYASIDPAEGTGKAVFDDVSFRAAFGEVYHLVFEPTLSDPAYSIESILSDSITARKCLGFQFQRITDPPSSYECEDCPEGARCSGTGVLIALKGYWRSAPNSADFQRCSSFSACLGYPDAEEGCAHGYTGAACSVCAEGYQRLHTGCRSCSAFGSVVGVLLWLCIGLVLFLAVTVSILRDKSSIRPEIQRNARRDLGGTLALTTDYLQTTSFLSLCSIPWGTGGMSWLLHIFNLSRVPYGLDCLLRWSGQGHLEYAFGIFSTTVLCAVAVSLLSKPALQYLAKKEQQRFARHTKKVSVWNSVKKDFVPVPEDYSRPGGGFHIVPAFLTSGMVAYRVFFPQLAVSALSLLHCHGSESIPRDMRATCSTVVITTGVFLLLAVVFAPVVGLFAAFAPTLTDRKNFRASMLAFMHGSQQKPGNASTTAVSNAAAPNDDERSGEWTIGVDQVKRLVASVFLPGLAADRWCWAPLGLVRTLCVASVVVFASDDGLTQVQGLLWVLEVDAFLLVAFCPYTVPVHARLGTAGKGVGCLTLVLAQLFFTSLQPGQHAFLSFVVVAVHVACLAYLLYHIVNFGRIGYADELDDVVSVFFPKISTPEDVQLSLLDIASRVPSTALLQESASDRPLDDSTEGTCDSDLPAPTEMQDAPPSAEPPNTPEQLLMMKPSLNPLLTHRKVLTSSTCLYCGSRFRDFDNRPGACSRSPLSGALHMATIEDELL
ncbi:Cell death abnormality protein 1 [Diplonema papillatum]|nr:Cell death abnormality protein 1 [Diplonema papillatum]